MNVVMTGANKFVVLLATAERTPFEDAQLGEVMSLARKGIAELRDLQRTVLAGTAS
jgi:ribonuclease PH